MTSTLPPQDSSSSSTEGLRRTLQVRHLSMIAIGGSIGTGLFVASGATVSNAGPGGALMAYTLIGIMVYFLMTSLGELAAYKPVSGSFSTYGTLYVDEGFGFALGWNYWFSWAVTIAVELVAVQLIMQYWFPDVPRIIWSATFLTLMFVLNAFSVRGFGEAEFWFSLIKVITVIAFIIVGCAMIFGIMKGVPSPGLSNLTMGDAPFVGGFMAMLSVAMVAGFSFQGTELVGVAAGESANPTKNIPRSIRQVFWRILLFYVMTIAIIGVLLPYTDPHLISASEENIGMSPFTRIFERAGLAFAAGMMNAVILTAVLSAGNSSMYASTRMLYNLATEGKAPAIFARLTRYGVPLNALIATTCVGALCFLSSLLEGQSAYLALLSLSAMTGFMVWVGIAVSHYRFRRGLLKQGISLDILPYRSPFYPWGPLIALMMCVTVILGQSLDSIKTGQLEWGTLIATYIGLVLFLACWAGWRIFRGGRIIPYEEMKFEIPPNIDAGATVFADNSRP